MKNILIYGSGKSGEAAFLLAKEKGFSPFIVDDRSFDERSLKNVDLIVVSPGVPFFHKIFKLAKEKNIEIIGETEFAYRFWNGKVVAVTGTDGKSTTTKLIYDILKEEKENVFIGGNYGIPFSEIVLKREKGTAVLELSSFQIYTLKKLKADIGVFLNISKDHLDWHKTFFHYLCSKYQLFKLQDKNSTAVLNFDNRYTKNTKTEGKKLFFSLKELPEKYDGIFLKEKSIFFKKNNEKTEILKVDNLLSKGIHFIQNVMAASTVGLVEGISIESIKKAVENFKSLPFRLEYEGKIEGIDVYNDAKSTTVQSLLMAIRSFPDRKLVVIAGGIDKGGDFSILKDEKNVKRFVLIGRDKEKIGKVLSKYFDIDYGNSLEEAVKKSIQYAEKNDVILFSPACASFDMFKNYIDRGETFKKIVEGLKC